MYQVNPLELIQMIKSGKNPQQLMISILEGELSNTPFGANLLTLAKNNNCKEIENIARNICAQKGLDYDREFAAFRKNMGI